MKVKLYFIILAIVTALLIFQVSCGDDYDDDESNASADDDDAGCGC